MESWEQENKPNSPRLMALSGILTQMEENDRAYLGFEIDKEKWTEQAKTIDERLAVIGLRLTYRPWLAK